MSARADSNDSASGLCKKGHAIIVSDVTCESLPEVCSNISR